MSVLVVGSVALDSVATPFGAVEEALGGSACYFSTSASFFSDVQLVAVIGDDFPEEHIDFLASRNIDLSGLQRSPGETFRWKGRYAYDLNEAQTLDTRLNVFEQFRPVLSALHREAEYVFLANIDPELQLEVLQQVKKPKLVACDTMNFWIGSKREALINTLGYVDILIINEAEVRQLADEPNLIKAAEIVRAFGPKTLVVKRGEYGVLMFTEHAVFSAPAYPLESVFDPTGAGDTFAGGFFGYLASTRNLDEASLRRATVFGTVMASFTVEKFSLERLKTLELKEIEERYQHLRAMTEFSLP
ncbi:PfkB family carbohydrate kinase [Geopsychrobacter electrodiphilus]|uniref:PfkB family carbohydrate kinase n=1 Tax=Geopsychrobacter electrodiphilus TaxID=225196 RepID=UPI00036FE2DC|nr:PfkB family carbohydrate kinase [Geopsychrobacter electrodiphilus]